jgi:hypothetical protein
VIVEDVNTDLRAQEPSMLMPAAPTLMRPERLSVIQPSRLSVSHALMAQATKGRWKIQCTRFDLDDRGKGVANYLVDADGWQFSFPVFSAEPNPAGRSARIIGTSWDVLGALVEGRISDADLATTERELPKLYEGRATRDTLVWARSNRSGRLFDEAVNTLAEGRQPEVAALARVGYLTRNTGLDGNGTFGTKTFLAFEKNHPLRWALGAQMLSAYMMRVFACDLLRHLSRAKGGSRAVEMNPDLQRFLGLGNGSAIGLSYFVHNHPRLIDRWLSCRHQALASAMLTPIGRDGASLESLLALLKKAIIYRRQDRSEYEVFAPSQAIAVDLEVIHRELERLLAQVRSGSVASATPLVAFCQSLDGRVHAEALETLHSQLIELVPDVADRLVKTLVVDEEVVGRPEMSVRRLREIIHADYAWAFGLDLDSERSQRYIWYKSATAEEPRRGPRDEVSQAHNIGLDLPRLVRALDADLAASDASRSVARFLFEHPQHRLIATRVQSLAGLAYHSPHGDIMSEDFIPAHVIRLMNAGIHGIDKTRDFLGRFIRGVLFQGAPLPEDIASGQANEHWFNPEEPA